MRLHRLVQSQEGGRLAGRLGMFFVPRRWKLWSEAMLLYTSQIEASTSPPRAFEFLENFCSNSPPHRAEKLFKYHHPGKITRLLF